MALRIYSQKYKQISYQPSRLPLTWSFHTKNYHWQAGIQDLRCLNKRVLSQQNLVQKALALLSARMSKVSPKSKAPFYWHVLYIRDFLHTKQLHRRSSVQDHPRFEVIKQTCTFTASRLLPEVYLLYLGMDWRRYRDLAKIYHSLLLILALHPGLLVCETL